MSRQQATPAAILSALMKTDAPKIITESFEMDEPVLLVNAGLAVKTWRSGERLWTVG